MNHLAKRPLLPGHFVYSSANSLGIGNLVDISSTTAHVKYFDSPAEESHLVETVSANTVQPAKLEQQRRVYFNDPNTLEWMVGRVLDYQSDDYQYLVQFPNSDRRMVPESNLRTRWLKPIQDPTSQLAFALNETAYWHAGRTRFVSSLLHQRRACCGMAAILSSAIDIEKHQIAVVRRVLQDPLQRYLLADEVGLGKTIEAGILIRQYILDAPSDHRVLIITPAALLKQWREELRTRFFLEEQLDRSVHLVAFDNREQIELHGKDAGMIVIDEAHHLADRAWTRVGEDSSFDLVAAITRPLERKLLLLSATPALHNERGFLAMLHLLDPAMYSLDDLEAFQERIRQRQRVAQVLSALRVDEPNLFMLQAVEDVAHLAPQDRHLTGLARELSQLLEDDPEEDNPQRTRLVTQLRSHISETWRLHRRILRTRRTKDSQVLLPGRDGATSHPWTSQGHARLDDAFHEWRITVAQGETAEPSTPTREQLVRVMAEAVSCDPSLVPLLVSTRLGDTVDLDGLALFPDELHALKSVPLLEGESRLLERLSDLAANVDLRDFYSTIQSVVETELPASASSKSIILFTNYPATADNLYRMLQKRFGPQQVFRHSPTSTTWLQALSGSGVRVLVCDRQAEEGLNLQGRHSIIVHSDLPLSPNRIEQRMGRVDRFGSGHGIPSHALLCKQSELQNVWLQTLDAVLQVFNRSIASLQYVIEAEFSRVWSEFLGCGCEALQEMQERLSGPTGMIEHEFKQVRSQAELDSFDYDSRRDARLVNELLNLERRSSELHVAANEWIGARLLFQRRGENGPEDAVFHYQFCRRDDSWSRSRSNDTLLPLGDFDRWLRSSFERAEDSHREILYESVPLTFDRQIAQRRFARLARVGDPLIDAFTQLLRTDDRGIAFALWRYLPDLAGLDSPAELAFRFDFVVEADAGPAMQVLQTKQAGTHTAIQRTLDGCFPPLYATIWLDSNMQMIRDNERTAILSLPYKRDWHSIDTTRVRDFNLNQARWAVVRRWWDADYWTPLCRQARVVAEEALRTAHELHRVCERSAKICRKRSQARCQSLESRRAISSAKLSGLYSRDIEFEISLAAAMESGINQPSVRLDSLGAIFLSNQNPFSEMARSDIPASGSRFDE
jgi:ATP-dependent helicase HepA